MDIITFNPDVKVSGNAKKEKMSSQPCLFTVSSGPCTYAIDSNGTFYWKKRKKRNEMDMDTTTDSVEESFGQKRKDPKTPFKPKFVRVRRQPLVKNSTAKANPCTTSIVDATKLAPEISDQTSICALEPEPPPISNTLLHVTKKYSSNTGKTAENETCEDVSVKAANEKNIDTPVADEKGEHKEASPVSAEAVDKNAKIWTKVRDMATNSKRQMRFQCKRCSHVTFSVDDLKIHFATHTKKPFTFFPAPSVQKTDKVNLSPIKIKAVAGEGGGQNLGELKPGSVIKASDGTQFTVNQVVQSDDGADPEVVVTDKEGKTVRVKMAVVPPSATQSAPLVDKAQVDTSEH